MLTSGLILMTWLGWSSATLGVGYLVVHAVFRSSFGRLSVHISVWVGLAFLVTFTAALNIATPIASTAGQALQITYLFGGWIGLFLLIRRTRAAVLVGMKAALTTRRIPVLIFIALVLFALFTISRFAAAEPMDYDAGLYRLGSINYAREFAVVPGITNLHYRFGFNSVLWPLAPFLEFGLWTGEGFRLVTGFLVTLLATDLLLRIAVPRRSGASPGDWLLVIASTFLMAIILTDSGRWIPSPAQDVAAFIPAIAAIALFADAFWKIGADQRLAMNGALVAGAIAGAMRPLGWILFTAMLLTFVGVLVSERIMMHRCEIKALMGLWPGLVLSSVLAVVMLIRDALLSGWLLFPLPLFGIDVPWRFPNPDVAVEVVGQWARDPGLSSEGTVGISLLETPWVRNLVESREAYLLTLILIGTLITSMATPSGRRTWSKYKKGIVLSLIAPTVYVGVWLATAPDPRFAWAGLVAIVAIPSAWLLAGRAYPAIPARIFGIAILVLMLGTQILNNRILPRGAQAVSTPLSWGPLSFEVTLAPPQQERLQVGTLADGTQITFPVDGENCWNSFPLCLPEPPTTRLIQRTDSIQGGFEPLSD